MTASAVVSDRQDMKCLLLIKSSDPPSIGRRLQYARVKRVPCSGRKARECNSPELLRSLLVSSQEGCDLVASKSLKRIELP